MTGKSKLTLGLMAPVMMGAILATSMPALAGWKRIETIATEVGKGAFVAAPTGEWNRWSSRPSKNGETWTKNGFLLNQLDFFGQIAPGETIFKDRKKKERPLPKYQANMLPTDLAELFEANFSIQHDVTKFDARLLEPVKLGGHDGIRMVYEYALPGDALTRVGEVRAAVMGGHLYLVNFTAPELHYFDASIGEVRTIMDTVQLK